VVLDATLKLVKTVDNTSAMPGSILTYTVTYTNQGTQPLKNLVVNDAVPAFTTFVSAAAGALPNNLTACIQTTPAGGPVACGTAQAAGGKGPLSWTFAGTCSRLQVERLRSRSRWISKRLGSRIARLLETPIRGSLNQRVADFFQLTRVRSVHLKIIFAKRYLFGE